MVFPIHSYFILCLMKFTSLASGFLIISSGFLTLILSVEMIFLQMVFPITHSLGSSFCLVIEYSLNCTQGFVLLCFFIDLFTQLHDF